MAASKNPQKKEIKKKISDKINNSIPIRKPSSNLWLWKPVILSIYRSLNHKIIIKVKKRNKKKLNEKFFIIKILTVLKIKNKRLNLIKKGQKELCNIAACPK